MLKSIVSIDKEYCFSYTISKSKFIAYAYRFDETSSIKDILTTLKKEEKGATHYCYAYKFTKGIVAGKVVDENFENQTSYDDNGEPTGTAGMKILKAITDKDATNVLIVVVRYFGGIKLGVGGLGRAYKYAADEVLKNATEQKLKLISQCVCDYSTFEKVKKFCDENVLKIFDCVFEDKVKFYVSFEECFLGKIEDMLTNAQMCIIGKRYD